MPYDSFMVIPHPQCTQASNCRFIVKTCDTIKHDIIFNKFGCPICTFLTRDFFLYPGRLGLEETLTRFPILFGIFLRYHVSIPQLYPSTCSSPVTAIICFPPFVMIREGSWITKSLESTSTSLYTCFKLTSAALVSVALNKKVQMVKK